MSSPTTTAEAADLGRLDGALVDLRRLWEQPSVRRRFGELLGRPVELSVLRALRAVEAAGDEAGVARVADLLKVDRSTASRAVDAAVEGGYVVRAPSAVDRRRTNLGLTDDGRRLLADARRARAALLAEATAGWSPADVTTLASLLSRFVSDMTALA